MPIYTFSFILSFNQKLANQIITFLSSELLCNMYGYLYQSKCTSSAWKKWWLLQSCVSSDAHNWNSAMHWPENLTCETEMSNLICFKDNCSKQAVWLRKVYWMQSSIIYLIGFHKCWISASVNEMVKSLKVFKYCTYTGYLLSIFWFFLYIIINNNNNSSSSNNPAGNKSLMLFLWLIVRT